MATKKTQAKAKEQEPPKPTQSEEAASLRVKTGGQDPNVPIPEDAKDPEPKTITPEELAKTEQPKAPEHPLEPKDVGNDPVPMQFDDTDPAPEGAPLPVEDEDKK